MCMKREERRNHDKYSTNHTWSTDINGTYETKRTARHEVGYIKNANELGPDLSLDSTDVSRTLVEEEVEAFWIDSTPGADCDERKDCS